MRGDGRCAQPGARRRPPAADGRRRRSRRPGPARSWSRCSACAICRTDLHVVEGELPTAAHAAGAGPPGRRPRGRARGRDATRFREGDRVGIAWLRRTCGRCLYCATDRENLCERAEFTGWHADGGYAEYAVVDEDYAYAIPAAFNDVEAAPLLCAGIIGYRALKLAAVRPGGRLGMYGFGSSAHVTIQLARGRNMEVYVCTREPAHRELAQSLGAAWVGDVARRRCRTAPRARSSSRPPASWCRSPCATWPGAGRWRWPAST